MKKLFKHLTTLILAAALAFQPVAPALADEISTPPTAPTPPPATTTETTPPPAPTPPPEPTIETTPPPAPTPPPVPNYESTTSNDETQDSSNQPGDTTNVSSDSQNSESSDNSTSTSSEAGSSSSGGGGVVGDTTIETGDATTTGTVVTTANSNTSASLDPNDGSSSDGISIVNNANGSDSTNTGSVSVADTNTTVQNNSAAVVNDGSLSATTGDNDSSGNVGNTTIETGDANTSGTLITSVNTNLDGVMVSEFNIADDHVGDYVLDFAANCISGCAGDNIGVTNTGNGAGSTNTGAVDSTTTDLSFQTNDATVLNSLVLDADSGNNGANKNTGGDSTIQTGDANVAANALTFANNNIEGEVIFGVVNIYGDLIGDIIFPEEMLTCCGSQIAASNIGNGADSTNTGTISSTTTDASFQNNTAVIDNLLVLDATTGANETSKNTGGDNNIETGSASIDAQVLNVANTNLDGTPMWLVIVNEAGKWIGRIFGAPEGSNFAGSSSAEFSVNEAGEITITNSGNGSGSTNTGSVSQTTTNTTVQTNTAHIQNTLDLSANTGGNTASKNTGGDNSITTGDATIIANLVNFANNNIKGGGKLFVTVVNVFGSWLGDFVGPGMHKEKNNLAQNAADPDPGIGGTDPRVSTGTPPSTAGLDQNNNSDDPTDNTPATTQNGNKKTLVAGGTQFSSPPQSQSLVAGFSTIFANPETLNSSVIQTNSAGQRVSINLAWLIFAVPLVIMAAATLKLVRWVVSHLIRHRLAPAA